MSWLLLLASSLCMIRIVALRLGSARDRGARAAPPGGAGRHAFRVVPDAERGRPRPRSRARPGDLLVFTQDMAFPGVLWNHSMSNRVEYVAFKAADDFLAELARRRPRWVVVGGSSAAQALLGGRAAEWEIVGPPAGMTGPWRSGGNE